MLAYLVGDQDLPADCLGHHAGRGMHRLPEQIAIPLGDLAEWTPMRTSTARCGSAVLCSSNARWMATARMHRCYFGGKGDQEPIAQRFAYPATECCDLVLHDRCLQRENVIGVLVATCPP
jgi:hypothetical protein